MFWPFKTKPKFPPKPPHVWSRYGEPEIEETFVPYTGPMSRYDGEPSTDYYQVRTFQQRHCVNCGRISREQIGEVRRRLTNGDLTL